MKKSLFLLFLPLTLLSFNWIPNNSSSENCDRIEILFLHDNLPVMTVRSEVVGALEKEYESKENIDQVTMSVIGNTARIWLNYKSKQSKETVYRVYKNLQKMVADGRIPDYVEGPYVGGCGIKLPNKE